MRVSRDESVLKWAVEEIQNNWASEKREGIHLTDLLTPRKKYNEIKNPIKPGINDILTWLPGIEFESRLKRALGIRTPDPLTWNGIIYSPDIFFNFPCELKMRRRWLADEDSIEEDYSWYLTQLMGYCALSGVRQGWLIVFTPVQKASCGTKPALDFVRVEFTETELQNMRQELLETKRLLEDALQKSNIQILPRCPEWMCYERILVEKPYCIDCNRSYQSDSSLQRHIKKTSHRYREAVYGKNPRCRYFFYCFPEGED